MIDKWKTGWINNCMDELINRRVNERMKLKGWINEWKDE